MISLLQKFFGRDSAAERDATKLYRALMEQARRPGFYGEGRMPDTQVGRLSILMVHVAPVMKALTMHGENGERLSQALFDVLREDFDTALREEGYSDSGVKRRIKPMIQRFYADLKAYSEALDEPDNSALQAAMRIDRDEETGDAFLDGLADSMRQFFDTLSSRSLGEIAQARLPILHVPS